jgi:hypothetical protein
MFGATLFVRVAYSQVDRVNLNGNITDASGASVPNARVELASPTTGLKMSALTGGSGDYSITNVPIGKYNLRISHQGFKVFEVTDLELFVNQPRTVNAVLQVGMTAQTIEVKAIMGVDANNAALAGVLQSHQVEDIPINGRDWATLMTLAPGAVNLAGGGQRDLRFVGRGIDDSNYTMDGIDATGVQEQSQKVGARLNISLESIAEFNVSSSVYPADIGGSAGAQVSVVTKSGTDKWHGGAFEFLRNNVLDSRSPFDIPSVPPFRLNQFGGSVGGPIKKDSTFFYADYEGLRQRLDTTVIGFVPNAAFRASVTNPAVTPFLAQWPVGQVAVDSQTAEWISPQSDNNREDSGNFRFDHNFSARTSMFARYNIDDADIAMPLDTVGGVDDAFIRPSNLVVELTHTFSPTVVNELRGGFNRSAMHHYYYGTGPLSTANGEPGYVAADVSGFDTPDATALDVEVGTTLDVYDNLSIVRGRHTIKVGMGLERHRLNNSDESIADGTLTYDSPQDYANNVVDDYEFIGQLTLGGERRTLIMPYAMDTFKARPNLTFNVGLRYEDYTVLKEAFGRQAVVTLACGGFCPKGTPLYFPDRTDFAPRLGVAWLPGGAAGKTVIRSGFGMYFSPNQMDDFTDGHESTGQRFDVSSSIVPNLAWPVLQSELPSPSYSPKAWDQHRRDGYFENWDFTIQRLFPHSFLGQIAYDGSEGHRQFSHYQVNLINPLTGTRPLPSFGQYGEKSNDGNSNFHSLQLSVKRPLTSGWLWETQYMWSHAMADNGFGAGEQQYVENMACIKCSYSSSAIDIRQTLSVNSVYQLPFGKGKRFLSGGGVAGKVLGGWELSGISSASTGRPIDIEVDRSHHDMLDGNTKAQRPDLVPGQSIYPSPRTINNWFNINAFAVPAVDTWGNLGRNVGRGPGYYEIDTALEKEMPITERLALKFRAEAFNLLNHPIYGDPESDISSPASFGVITTPLNTGATGIGTPRRIQFMLRLEF